MYIYLSICIYISICTNIGIMVRVFANGLGDLGSISWSSHTKDSKNGTCLTLSLIRYGSRVK